MKYSYKWLKEYYKTSDSVEKTGELITKLGSEVESISGSASVDAGIIAVKINKIIKHPNADRLQLATVSDGKKEITVVCGAQNIEEGQIVPYAKPGVKLIDLEVEEIEIRGVKSPGMLLSERELGISDDHEGIKILDENTKLGTSVVKVLSPDRIIEAEITPNRGDLLSHFGLSRDLSAASGKILDKPELEIKESDTKAEKEVNVEIKSEKCPLYIARVIKGVKVGQSPQWLKDRLVVCGINPVNNVVDVTNYIMLDLGHPLHAFDAKKVVGSRIIVDEVKKEQEVVCLDGKSRPLMPGILCIYDDKSPIAIAGVMGLQCSEIDDQTKDVILEAAVFDRKSVRKTAKLLNIKTEASYRFERGVDDRGTSYAIKKAAKMIAEIAGGEILSGEVVSGKIQKQGNVKIEYQKINELLGIDFPRTSIDKHLQALGFELNEDYAYIPGWRHDISIWQDLAEEAGRLEGLDKIKPEYLPVKEAPKSGKYYQKEKIKDILVELGLDEAITYTFLSEEDIKTVKIKTDNLLEVANPIQVENRYLRNSLIPGLLRVIAKAPSFDDIEIFELGHIFDKDKERESLAIITCGKSSRQVEKIIRNFAVQISIDPKLFKMYEISRDELKRFKIKKSTVCVAEVEVESLLKEAQFSDLDITDQFEAVQYRPISKFPPVSRDMAFIVDRKYNLDEIEREVIGSSDAVILVEPFDEFVNDRFGKDKKSVAFHVYLQNMGKTMLDQEAEIELRKIIKTLEQKFEAKIRS